MYSYGCIDVIELAACVFDLGRRWYSGMVCVYFVYVSDSEGGVCGVIIVHEWTA